VENQKPVFHFSTAPIPLSQNQNKKPKPNGGLRPQRPKRLKEKPMKGDIVAAGYSSHTEVATSGSLRIGMNRLFQAHLALESNLGFRLISGLENAPLPRRAPGEPGGRVRFAPLLNPFAAMQHPFPE